MSRAEERACQYTGYCKNQSYSDFLNGYYQAEEDLSDISWIKEVSGVKEMSRAKEEALKAYPPQSIAANYDTIDRRDAFEYGYLKAEKDNELTWDDVSLLNCLLNEVEHEFKKGMHEDKTYIGYCKEVLKRFKDLKKMILQKDDFKIQDDGIWIRKKALEECKQHYKQVAEYCFDEKNELQTLFYIGKSDVCKDLLKYFEKKCK